MVTLLDTNCLLRYLLADIPEQYEHVCEAVEEGAATSPEFIAECAYVLGGAVYHFDRAQVADALLALLAEVDCEHMAAMQAACRIYRNERGLDFPDCILAARHYVEDACVLTFDKKLNAVIQRMDEGDTLA